MKGELSLKSIVWALFWSITFFLTIFFLIREPITWGGDIAEYYGASESLLNHGTPNLTSSDRNNLEKILNPEYFKMQGYYVKGQDGARYPVHFFFYSILIIPFRILLQIIGQPPIKALTFANITIFSSTLFFILKENHSFWRKKLIFLITICLSPIIYFIAWPGPDILYLCLMLLSFYFFFKEQYRNAALVSAIASWHSQPLLIFSLGILAFWGWDIIKAQWDNSTKHLSIHLNNIKLTFIIEVALVILLLAIPYIYNLIAFGVTSPWSILKDFWTEYYGFGIHNASLQKLLEQFIDPNIGLFWYLPVPFIIGFRMLYKGSKASLHIVFFVILIILTAVGYQTNPAWHYGTAGYGPTRHAIFIIPLLILLFVEYIKNKWQHILLIGLFIFTQIYILSFNSWITPNWLSVLNHSPYARYLLDHHPELYNPTPEIFVDRTNHTDIDYPTSAFYKKDGICTKAYVLLHERGKAITQCGYIPEEYEKYFVQSKKLTDIEKARNVKTTRALLLNRTYGCDPTFKPLYDQPYVCLKTIADVIRYTGITDVTRIRPLKGIAYGWEISWGKPQTITVPPGYGIEYYSFEGIYINY